eukprot:8216972-Karenia_brevis.AAC.1
MAVYEDYEEDGGGQSHGNVGTLLGQKVTVEISGTIIQMDEEKDSMILECGRTGQLIGVPISSMRSHQG